MRLLYLPLLLLILNPPLFTLDLYVNGVPEQSYPIKHLREMTYSIPLEATSYSGITLDEVFPVMSEAYRLEIGYDTKTKSWERDDLAELLPRFYLLDSGNHWDLVFDHERYRNITGMKLWGDRLAKTTLEVWISWEGARRLKAEIKRFERLHGVTIKVVEVPRTQAKLLAVLRAKGKLPDVVMIQSDYLPSLKTARALQNLDYMDTDTVVEKGLQAFEADGKIWAMPFYFDSQVVFYNPKLLDEQVLPLGFPLEWSLADLEEMAKVLKNRGIVPLAWNAYSAYWLVPFQVCFGKEPLINGDGSMRIDDPATRRAIEYILDLKERDLMQVMERDAMISLFASGRIALILSGSYSIPLFRDIGIDFEVAAYPHNRQMGKPVAPLLDFKALAITRKSRNPVLSRRLIQYLTGVGVQQRFTMALSKLPADRSTWKLMENDNPYYKVLLKNYEIGIPVPPEKAYGVFKNTMWKLLRLVLSDQMSVAEVLEKGQRVLDAR